MKDKKCKCGHMKSEHDKILYVPTLCNQCNCSDFTKETYPVKSSKIFMYALIVIFIISAVSTTIDIGIELSDPKKAVREMMEEDAYETLYSLQSLRIMLVTLYGFFMIWVVKTVITSERKIDRESHNA